MAQKATYIYRVEAYDALGALRWVDFCYARNGYSAVQGIRLERANEDTRRLAFKAIPLGTADTKLHPDFFESMPSEEKNWLMQNRGTAGEKYSQGGKQPETFIPEDAVFIPAGGELP